MTRSGAAGLGALIAGSISVCGFLIRLLLWGGGTIDLALAALLDRVAGSTDGSLPSWISFVGLTATYLAAGACLGTVAGLFSRRSRRRVALAACGVGAIILALQVLLGLPVVFG